MKTITASFYGEASTFTASEWDQQEVFYIRNSDEAVIFYGSEAQKEMILERFGSHFDSMILISDDGVMVMFTNEPLSNEQLLEIEDASITFNRFEKSDYGVYELIDLEAE